MGETWGSIYYEIKAQIESLELSDIQMLSVGAQANSQILGEFVTSLDNFLHERRPKESLTSLSEAEMKSLQDIYNTKVMELTGGRVNATASGVYYTVSNYTDFR